MWQRSLIVSLLWGDPSETRRRANCRGRNTQVAKKWRGKQHLRMQDRVCLKPLVITLILWLRKETTIIRLLSVCSCWQFASRCTAPVTMLSENVKKAWQSYCAAPVASLSQKPTTRRQKTNCFFLYQDMFMLRLYKDFGSSGDEHPMTRLSRHSYLKSWKNNFDWYVSYITTFQILQINTFILFCTSPISSSVLLKLSTFSGILDDKVTTTVAGVRFIARLIPFGCALWAIRWVVAMCCVQVPWETQQPSWRKSLRFSHSFWQRLLQVCFPALILTACLLRLFWRFDSGVLFVRSFAAVYE